MSGRRAAPHALLTPEARAIVDHVRREDGVRLKAKNPEGAFVLIAAALGSPLEETAAMCGLPVERCRALVRKHGVLVTQRTMHRLAAWVRCLMARVSTPGASQAECVGAAWDGLVTSPAAEVHEDGQPCGREDIGPGERPSMRVRGARPAPLKPGGPRADKPPRKFPSKTENGRPGRRG